MKRTFWPALLLLLGLQFAAAAQAPQTPPAASSAQNKGEKTINRHATAANGDLTLYTEPSTESKSFKLFGKRPIHIYSQVDSVWYRAVHDGAQVFVKRSDVVLAPEAGATAGKGGKKPARRR